MMDLSERGNGTRIARILYLMQLSVYRLASLDSLPVAAIRRLIAHQVESD